MITPFVPELVREVQAEDDTAENLKCLSYGTSSYGYDLRLSPREFKTFRHIPGTIINPKRFNPKNLEDVELQEDEDGQFFVIPGHNYALGVSLERIKVPPNITILFIGKSTYARLGIIANLTPGEASWEGHLTIEIFNASVADCRIYANEGILQALFLEGEPCKTTYKHRDGKYDHQPHQIVMARV
jgi:dCTP deaminase